MISKPTYKHKKPPLNIPESLIKQVDERDKHICQRCGQAGTERHHISFGGGLGRRRIHAIENLITLCTECHIEAHSDNKVREWCLNWSRERYRNAVDLIKQYGQRWRDYL
jgi:5-methylcytosine-specific restriction endonuclease McrA